MPLLRAPALRVAVSLLSLSLAACQPAQDESVQRIALDTQRPMASDPIASPDTSKAVWSPHHEDRLLFGDIGERPFLSLACEKAESGPQIRIVRHLAADAEAQALFAFVGNGTVARIPVDATWRGDRWRWEGTIAADAPKLDVLTGKRALIATLPGGGTLKLPASDAPGQFIRKCRAGIDLQAVERTPGPEPAAAPTASASPNEKPESPDTSSEAPPSPAQPVASPTPDAPA